MDGARKIGTKVADVLFKYALPLGMGIFAILMVIDLPEEKEKFIDAFDILSFGLLILALTDLSRQRQESNRMNKVVRVVLGTKDGKKSHTVPVELRRSQLTRAEVLGLLGLIPLTPSAKKRQNGKFEIESTSKNEFFLELKKVFDGKEDAVLYVICTEKETKQFAIEFM